jgi:hypothetical protein
MISKLWHHSLSKMEDFVLHRAFGRGGHVQRRIPLGLHLYSQYAEKINKINRKGNGYRNGMKSKLGLKYINIYILYYILHTDIIMRRHSARGNVYFGKRVQGIDKLTTYIRVDGAIRFILEVEEESFRVCFGRVHGSHLNEWSNSESITEYV